MFRSALVKLTSFYFAILFTVSLTFSISTYVVASERLSRGALRQTELIQDFANRPGFFPGQDNPPIFEPQGEFRKQINEQLEKDQQELLQSLVLANIAVLAAGTFLCFFFAKRTLTPIEKAHQAQVRFTSDASHELRTPLSVMKTEIEVALKKDLSAPELKDVLSSNLEEIERLTELSNQLLALTRTEDPADSFVEFNVSQLITADVKRLEKQYDISIETHISSDISMVGAPPLISDLLRILIDNAVKYCGSKPPAITVTLVKTSDKNVELIVRDSGMGIAPDEIEHIFERFYRTPEASNQRRNGHGLGLSLASEIAKQHGTRINVNSQLGKFTEFKVSF